VSNGIFPFSCYVISTNWVLAILRKPLVKVKVEGESNASKLKKRKSHSKHTWVNVFIRPLFYTISIKLFY
jgi:hypothetical protein